MRQFLCASVGARVASVRAGKTHKTSRRTAMNMKLLQSSNTRTRRAGAKKPREQMPLLLPPMLAVLAQQLPAKPTDYAFEYKWDGVRAICRWDGRSFSLQS